MNKVLLATGAVVAMALLLGCAHPFRHGDLRAAGHPTCGDGNCNVPVYVETNSASACIVQVAFEEVHVGPGKKPLVVWALEPVDTSDGYMYRFQPAAGVFFKPHPPITPDDFIAGPAMGPDKFSWKSVNRRTGRFEYGVAVQRRPSGGVDAGVGIWQDCPVLDPRIVNAG